MFDPRDSDQDLADDIGFGLTIGQLGQDRTVRKRPRLWAWAVMRRFGIKL